MALSARMLAASAVRAGYRCIAVDLFADRDTRSIADCVRLSSFQEPHVLGALAALHAEYGRLPLIYGSGLDSRLDLLEQMKAYVQLVGNSTGTLQVVQDPTYFFGLLDRLRIPYPEIRFDPPGDASGWLFKIAFTEGGFGVLPASAHIPGTCGYFQRKIDSPSYSVSFIANRKTAQILGFNTQLQAALDNRVPYRFSGIINRASLSPAQKASLASWIHRLVESIELVGFHSLDFVIVAGAVLVLELNPRPCASLMLYDQDFASGLVNAHIRAVTECQLQKAQSTSRRVRGLEIVYANSALRLPQSYRWPRWAVDRPATATRIYRGDAICTITASGGSQQSVRFLLRRRRYAILKDLGLEGLA